MFDGRRILFFVLNVKKGTLPTFFLALPTIFYVKK